MHLPADNKKSTGERLKKPQAHWLFNGYLGLCALASITNAMSAWNKQAPLNWSYQLLILTVGISAGAALYQRNTPWDRRVARFAVIVIACTSGLLINALQENSAIQSVLLIYPLAIASFSLFLGFSTVIEYALAVSVILITTATIYRLDYVSLLPALGLSYAATLLAKIITLLREKKLLNEPHTTAHHPQLHIQELTSKLKSTHQTLESKVDQLQQSESRLNRLNQELELLNHASQAFNSTLDLKEVLAAVLDAAQHIFSAQEWSVWLIDQEAKTLACHHVAGPRSEALHRLQVSAEDGIMGWVIQNRTSAIIADTRDEARHSQQIDLQTGFKTRSILCSPLKVKTKIIGVIKVADIIPQRFTQKDLKLVENLATTGAVAIENARLYEAAQKEITERKRAEEALRASEERYHTLIQTSPDAISVTDFNGIIHMANQQTASLYGLESIEKTIGHNGFDFIAPECHPQAMENLEKTFQTGVSQNCAYIMVKANGERFWGEVSVSLIRDKQGQPQGYIGVARDITDRKNTERALRQSNEELNALNAIATTVSQHHNLGQLIYATLNTVFDIFKVNSGWIYLNNQDKHQTDRDNLVYRGFPQEKHTLEDAIELSLELSKHVIQTKAPLLLQTVVEDTPFLQQAKQEKLFSDAACYPIQSQSRILGVLGLSNFPAPPITAQENNTLSAIGHQIGLAVDNIHLSKAAAEVEILRELNHLRSELIANFSHDLRTPLGLIKIACTTLLRDDVNFGVATQREFLQDIENESDRLSSIVDNILDIGRMKNGHIPLDRHLTDLEQLTKDVAKAMEMRLAQHEFIHDFPDTPLVTSVDTERIEEVVRNLLDNAIKYSPDGGRITLRGRKNEDHILIQVSDEGLGMPEDELAKAFERFYRGRNGRIQHIRGVGLGLAVCQSIIDAHSGEIWIESKLGMGSTVSFTLPTQNGLA